MISCENRFSCSGGAPKGHEKLRWKVARGIGIEDRPFAKSTLQLFRAQLILHDKVRAVFVKSLSFARKTGYLKNRKIKAAVDTTNILGRGAVKDTYNPLADGIVKLVGALASLAGGKPEDWAAARGLSRYFGGSFRGEASIEWENKAARRSFLQGVVADADRLLEEARQVRESYAEGSAEDQQVVEAAQLLGQLLLQDVERRAGSGILIMRRTVGVGRAERGASRRRAPRFFGQRSRGRSVLRLVGLDLGITEWFPGG